ncbi:hypothetical protein STEG23_028229 [Scotinomys teguina]
METSQSAGIIGMGHHEWFFQLETKPGSSCTLSVHRTEDPSLAQLVEVRKGRRTLHKAERPPQRGRISLPKDPFERRGTGSSSEGMNFRDTLKSNIGSRAEPSLRSKFFDRSCELYPVRAPQVPRFQKNDRYACEPCAFSAKRGQKRISGPLKLEIQMVVNHSVGVGN